MGIGHFYPFLRTFTIQKDLQCILLQKSYSNCANEKLWVCEWGGKIFFAHGDNKSRGVAALLKNSFKPTVEKIISDLNGKYLLLEVASNDKILVLGNVYSPTKDEPSFFDSLFSVISGFAKSDLILGGDWNVVFDDQLDKHQGSIYSNKKAKEKLKSYINCFNLHDIFREMHPSKKAYTRFQAQPYIATRLDFFLTSNSLHGHGKPTSMCQSVKSDHKVVCMKIRIELVPWGRGYWKFNYSLLLDNIYIELIKKVICDFQINNPTGHVSPHTLWELLTCIIKGETIKYCAIEKKQRNKLQLLLESKISTLESCWHNCDPIDRNDIFSSINTAQNDLNYLLENNTKGASARSRARWIEFGKNSKYFFGLEKRHNDKKFIRLLRN